MPTFIRSSEPSLYSHLALESLLLEDASLDLPAVMVWDSPASVVFGKNQNPWKECDLAWMQQQGLLPARRLSGGGAVYHGPGNLNISWILPRDEYDGRAMQQLQAEALSPLGVHVHVNEKGNLFVDDRKIAGVAYCFRKERVLHHGTLLIDADLDALHRSLAAPTLHVTTHAVDSVPARVANLRDWLPSLRREDVEQVLRLKLERVWGAARVLDTRDFSGVDLDTVTQELGSPEWIWDQTPNFVVKLPLAGRTLALQARRGVVKQLSVDGRDDTEAGGLGLRVEFPAYLASRFDLPVGDIHAALAAEGLDLAFRL